METSYTALVYLSLAGLAISGGEQCISDAECGAGTLLCLGGFCCATDDQWCSLCARKSGSCLACKNGYYLAFSGKCESKVAEGEQCDFDSMCASDICKSTCCTSSAVAANCESCDTGGSCLKCKSSYLPDVTTGSCILSTPAPTTTTTTPTAASGESSTTAEPSASAKDSANLGMALGLALGLGLPVLALMAILYRRAQKRAQEAGSKAGTTPKEPMMNEGGVMDAGAGTDGMKKAKEGEDQEEDIYGYLKFRAGKTGRGLRSSIYRAPGEDSTQV